MRDSTMPGRGFVACAGVADFADHCATSTMELRLGPATLYHNNGKDRERCGSYKPWHRTENRARMFEFGRFWTGLHDAIWNADLASLSPARRRLHRLVRGILVVARDVSDGQLRLQAMGLVYTTLLSLVPLLAVSFSVLKAFGIHNQIEPLLLHFLAPLGDKGGEITAHIIGFVENIKVGVLGALGVGMLIYTVASLVQKVEQAFNYTWHVEQTRPLAQRFSQYLSVLTVGPVLVFSAMGLTATLMNASIVKGLVAVEPLGAIVRIIGTLVPYALVIAAFSFVYAFIPNTKVHLRSAAVGWVIAGILWEASGWLFASFVVSSTQYSAIYSGFAILIMFMIWLYLSWLILLVGASIAFYHQHPESLAPNRREPRLSIHAREKLTFIAMTLIGRSYYANKPAWTSGSLAQHINTPAIFVEMAMDTLVRRGLVARTADDPPQFLPMQAPDTVTLKSLLDAVRAADEGETGGLTVNQLPKEPYVDSLISQLDRSAEEALRGKSLKDLALSSQIEPAGTRPATAVAGKI